MWHLIGEHLVGSRAGPAHPGGGGLGVVAELLRHALGTAARAEGADGRGSGLPDLVVAGLLRALQCRHELGIGSDGAVTEAVLAQILRQLSPSACVDRPAPRSPPACDRLVTGSATPGSPSYPSYFRHSELEQLEADGSDSPAHHWHLASFTPAGQSPGSAGASS